MKATPEKKPASRWQRRASDAARAEAESSSKREANEYRPGWSREAEWSGLTTTLSGSGRAERAEATECTWRKTKCERREAARTMWRSTCSPPPPA